MGSLVPCSDCGLIALQEAGAGAGEKAAAEEKAAAAKEEEADLADKVSAALFCHTQHSFAYQAVLLFMFK